MMKLGIWRRMTRDGASGGSAAEATGPAVNIVAADTPVTEAPAGPPAVAADKPTAKRFDDDEIQLLRQAAMIQHEDTVPAAFYRAHSD